MNLQQLRPNLTWWQYGIVAALTLMTGWDGGLAGLLGVLTASFLFVWLVVAVSRRARPAVTWRDLGERFQRETATEK